MSSSSDTPAASILFHPVYHDILCATNGQTGPSTAPMRPSPSISHHDLSYAEYFDNLDNPETSTEVPNGCSKSETCFMLTKRSNAAYWTFIFHLEAGNINRSLTDISRNCELYDNMNVSSWCFGIQSWLKSRTNRRIL